MAVLHPRSSAAVIYNTFLGSAMLLSTGCIKDAPVDSADTLPDSLGRCNQDPPPTWSDVDFVFEEYCTTCHASDKEEAMRQGAPIGIDYDSAEKARLNSDLTWQMIAMERMPLQGPMPFEEALLVWDWLSCGGPE